ncbi:MAG: hypothetical protein L3J04_07375 [Robiginitomaculum sp.]|nr:hypothetical protein [Robiginitomaculum sp.]
MSKTSPAKVGIIWYLFLGLVVVLGFLFHEAAHWLAGEALGNEMAMSIGRAWPIDGNYLLPIHAPVISFAGPIFTILVALLGMYVAIRYSALWGYALVFSSFMFRALAFLVSINNPNDEARISLYFGLPWFVLPAIVALGLLWITIKTSRSLQIGWRTNVLAYVVVSAVVTVLIMADGQLPGIG